MLQSCLGTILEGKLGFHGQPEENSRSSPVTELFLSSQRHEVKYLNPSLLQPEAPEYIIKTSGLSFFPQEKAFLQEVSV